MEKENVNVKWEYKIVVSSRLYSSGDDINPGNGGYERKKFITESLNGYGDKGWEVCGYECGTYLLKRIKQE